MIQPGRNGSLVKNATTGVMEWKTDDAGDYRYGFNGKEMDNEVSGDGNQYDYGFRIYNPRLGRFLSIDPLFKSYPWFTPYQFAANDPIRNIDIDGLEGGSAIEHELGVLKAIADDALYKVKSAFSINLGNTNTNLPATAPNKPAPPIKSNEAKPVLGKVTAKEVSSIAKGNALIFSNKVSEEFQSKVIKISDNLGINPNHLMACMAFESAGTFSASVKNQAGSSGTGLIQFMASTAKSLGTTTKDLAQMSEVEQLDYVEKYFQDYKGKLKTVDDLYMSILYPKAVGKENDFVLFSTGTKAYEQNAGLDADGSGDVTKQEASAGVRSLLEKGQKQLDKKK